MYCSHKMLLMATGPLSKALKNKQTNKQTKTPKKPNFINSYYSKIG